MNLEGFFFFILLAHTRQGGALLRYFDLFEVSSHVFGLVHASHDVNNELCLSLPKCIALRDFASRGVTEIWKIRMGEKDVLLIPDI